jgi:hypothetical protein
MTTLAVADIPLDAGPGPVPDARREAAAGPAGGRGEGLRPGGRPGGRDGLRGAGRAAGAAWRRVRLVGRFKVQLVTALGVWTAAGVAAYFAGPSLATAAAWLAGFTTALAVQAGLALRRLLAAAVSGT